MERFTATEYETPAERPTGLAMRLLPGRTAPFYWYVLKSILWGRSRGVKGEFDDEALVECSLRFAEYTEVCGGRLHVTGLDSLRSTPGAVVFVANHMSVLETFLLPGMIGQAKPLEFVVKESLVSHPLFGPLLQSLGAITVTRKNIREDLRCVLEQGTRALHSGRSMCVFPQSTRRTDFVESMFNTMGARLAHRAGVAVIPIALRTDFWQNGKLIKDMGRIDCARDIQFAFGQPIPPADHPKIVHQQVLEFLRQHLPAWGVSWTA